MSCSFLYQLLIFTSARSYTRISPPRSSRQEEQPTAISPVLAIWPYRATSRQDRSAATAPVVVENSATGRDLQVQAACQYSWMRPPRTVRRWIRSFGTGNAITFGSSFGARRPMPWPWWLRPAL